jgi:hypothetical protein
MFAMGMQLPFLAGLMIQVITALAVTVAPSPGQLGVFHLTAVHVLTRLFGSDPNQALAYAFVLHGLSYLMLMALGLLGAWREGLNLAEIQNISAQNRAADAADVLDDAGGRNAAPNGAAPGAAPAREKTSP